MNFLNSEEIFIIYFFIFELFVGYELILNQSWMPNQEHKITTVIFIYVSSSELGDSFIALYQLTNRHIFRTHYYFITWNDKHFIHVWSKRHHLKLPIILFIIKVSLNCNYVFRIWDWNEVTSIIWSHNKHLISNNCKLLNYILLLTKTGKFFIDFLLSIGMLFSLLESKLHQCIDTNYWVRSTWMFLGTDQHLLTSEAWLDYTLLTSIEYMLFEGMFGVKYFCSVFILLLSS